MIQALSLIDKAGSSVSSLSGLANMAGPAMKTQDVNVETTFSAALASVSANAVDTLKSAEGLSMKALQGELEVREVVDAVMTAEQTLQTAVAIRDKIVSSYLEISRMAI